MKVRDLVFLVAVVLLLAVFYTTASERPPWCLTGAGGLVLGVVAGIAFVWARRCENDDSSKCGDYVVLVGLVYLILWLGLSAYLGADVSPLSGAVFFLATGLPTTWIILTDQPPPTPTDEPDPRDPRLNRDARGMNELGDSDPQEEQAHEG